MGSAETIQAAPAAIKQKFRTPSHTAEIRYTRRSPKLGWRRPKNVVATNANVSPGKTTSHAGIEVILKK